MPEEKTLEQATQDAREGKAGNRGRFRIEGGAVKNTMNKSLMVVPQGA